ncbi:hypothetical protein HPB48_013808 [Haemaphysalis longicornis]|uniref:Sodium-dependent multivitamin transporter n=1 Tax=Haemaphysalis longicornis TaxID=44386 RepID=A0A9J6FB26_HAELO|nr:hypothetical protein HPB48_013808 [Haemaphysalis longicornis]
MDVLPLHIADYVLLVLLIIFGIGVGLYVSFVTRRSKVAAVLSIDRCLEEQEEAFLGSRRLFVAPLSVSVFASALTSTTVVSFGALYYAYGFNTLWAIASIAVLTPAVAHTFVPVVYNLRITSVFQVSSSMDDVRKFYINVLCHSGPIDTCAANYSAFD